MTTASSTVTAATEGAGAAETKVVRVTESMRQWPVSTEGWVRVAKRTTSGRSFEREREVGEVSHCKDDRGGRQERLGRAQTGIVGLGRRVAVTALMVRTGAVKPGRVIRGDLLILA